MLRLSSKVIISKVELCKIKISKFEIWTFSTLQVNSEKVTYGGKLPQGLLFLENWHFLNFKTCLFFKSMHFLILGIFFKNGSPEQTTMLMRRAAKFWVEPRSPFSEIFHQESKTLGKRLNIVSWPECQPEFPNVFRLIKISKSSIFWGPTHFWDLCKNELILLG